MATSSTIVCNAVKRPIGLSFTDWPVSYPSGERMLVVTVTAMDCSLWANLRNQKVAALAFSSYVPLPTVEALLHGPEPEVNVMAAPDAEG